MSNSDKYIPKVGEKALTDLGTECLVLYVGEEHVFVRSDSEEFSADFDYFRPIPNKADVEREQLNKMLYDYRTQMGGDNDMLIDIIQNAGFTIPKKVKRSDIVRILHNTSTASTANDTVVAHCICNLLGDLVEDES